MRAGKTFIECFQKINPIEEISLRNQKKGETEFALLLVFLSHFLEHAMRGNCKVSHAWSWVFCSTIAYFGKDMLVMHILVNVSALESVTLIYLLFVYEWALSRYVSQTCMMLLNT